MSIRFACPVCQTKYAVNDRNAGKKSDCKVCGQRLQVPAKNANKTVLGESVSPESPSVGNPPPLPRRRVKPTRAVAKIAESKLTTCEACQSPIAKEADACPKCGAPNTWIHPELERFFRRIRTFRRWYPNFAAEAKGSVLVISSTRSKQFMDYAANAVGGLGVIAPLSLGGLALVLGASIGTQYAADAIRQKAGPYTQVLAIDFRHDPPRWSSTSDDFWEDLIEFFELRWSHRE
jgi:hypothetical protein